MVAELVYVKQVSLEPAGELTSLILPEQVDRCIIWPLVTYTEFLPEMLPPDPLPEPVLEMSGARHEWVHSSWNVSNFLKGTDEPLQVSFTLSDLTAPSGAKLAAADIDVLSLEKVAATWKGRSRADEQVWQALKPQKSIEVPAGETRQMWLATRLPAIARPGLYQGTLTANWPDGSQQLTVRLRVWNFRLPDESPLMVSGWVELYSWTTAHQRWVR